MEWKTCELCKIHLINIGEEWVHPETDCAEQDGKQIVILDEFLAKKFDKKYGIPKKSPHELLDIEIKNSQLDTTKFKEEIADVALKKSLVIEEKMALDLAASQMKEDEAVDKLNQLKLNYKNIVEDYERCADRAKYWEKSAESHRIVLKQLRNLWMVRLYEWIKKQINKLPHTVEAETFKEKGLFFGIDKGRAAPTRRFESSETIDQETPTKNKTRKTINKKPRGKKK